MSFLRCLIGTALATVAGPTSCLQTAPPPPPVVEEQGPREYLLAATVDQMVFAHADYPAGTTTDQVKSGAVLPAKVMLLAVKPDDGERKKLHPLFSGPLQHVPVSDGRWLAAVDSAGTVWLVDISDQTLRELPLGQGAAAPVELWALQEPWLVARDAAGPFACHIVTQERVDLPAGARLSLLALAEDHLAFVLPSPGAAESEPVRIQLLDLASLELTTVASAPDPQLFMEPGQLTYIVYDEAEDSYVVHSYVFADGVDFIRLRLRATPQAGETQFIADVASRGYLLVAHSISDLGYLYEELLTLRRSGEREFIHGYVANIEAPEGQPRLVGPYLVFTDLRDGAWTISNIEELWSSRSFLFRNME